MGSHASATSGLWSDGFAIYGWSSLFAAEPCWSPRSSASAEETLERLNGRLATRRRCRSPSSIPRRWHFKDAHVPYCAARRATLRRSIVQRLIKWRSPSPKSADTLDEPLIARWRRERANWHKNAPLMEAGAATSPPSAPRAGRRVASTRFGWPPMTPRSRTIDGARFGARARNRLDNVSASAPARPLPTGARLRSLGAGRRSQLRQNTSLPCHAQACPCIEQSLRSVSDHFKCARCADG